ncbi:uncharacterized protein LOC141601076 [Silene latifolia]|uniref:uncharacterized protein LOC141601076 n=1 Tax=Silene latifolia TaxID=37657 RepID=UPI003D76B905
MALHEMGNVYCGATTPCFRKQGLHAFHDRLFLQVDRSGGIPQVLARHVISFIKRNIICRFDIPSEIVCDNGAQFLYDKMEAFCARWNIALFKSTPRNPQSNGQAKSSNKIAMENLKKRLEEIEGKWADELPRVLWSDRTTPKVATGQTPFSLVYGAEAVIPSEVRVPTHRYGCITEDRN